MKRLLLSLALLSPVLAGAQDLSHPWTLPECLDWALEHNLTIRQGAITVQEQEIRLNSARNNRFPTVSGSAGESVNFGRGLTSDNWDELGPLEKVVDYLWHVTLPVTASVVSLFAMKTLLTKNMFLEEIRRQYVLTARAKGLSERRILWKHVFRNTLLPLITGFPATFIGAFFTGSLLIETLFSLDGLGLLAFESINNRDYPVVLGTLYLFTLIGLLIKLLADLAYALVDPRIKFSAQES